MAKLTDSDFEIFELPCRFEIDEAQLNASWLSIQSKTHPDRFANGSPQEKRLAVQWATRINEAYKRLSNPVERVIYWCELQGENPRGQQSSLPPAMLMKQMEWRETLEEAADLDELDDLLSNVLKQKKALIAQAAVLIDQQSDPSGACMKARELMFVDKLVTEIKKKIEILEDAG